MDKRELVNKANLDKIRVRVDRRKYNKMTEDVAGFSNRQAYQKQRDKEEMNFVMAFGIGFITMTFLGFLFGYAFGKAILIWDDEQSLILSLVTGISTLILESVLMLFRLNKWEQKRERDKKTYKLD